MSAPYSRRGVTVVEVLAALLLGLIVVHVSLGLFEQSRRAQRAVQDQAETIATLRIARHVLRSELRVGVAGRDWTATDGDSLSVRAFRGLGTVCPQRPSPTELLVAYSGVRMPDPEKDSVLFVTVDGSWAAADLVGSSPTGTRCALAPESPLQLWRFSGVPPVGTVLGRVYERGTYYASDGALRYRRGAGGRQPLTPEVLDTRLGGFRVNGGATALELVPIAGYGEPWLGFVGGSDDDSPAESL